ncbi:MAG: transposase [Bacteroidota bacterium]
MKNPKQTLGKIVRWYKARTTKIVHDSGEKGFRWQRNYYERIIRDERALTAIQKYILNNPAKWKYDKENQNMM